MFNAATYNTKVYNSFLSEVARIISVGVAVPILINNFEIALGEESETLTLSAVDKTTILR